MAIIDPKTAMNLMLLGQSIRDEHKVKPSLLYDGARKPQAIRVSKPLSRNQRRVMRRA